MIKSQLAKELDIAWEKLCATNMVEASFRNVGLTLNIDGCQDSQMKFEAIFKVKNQGNLLDLLSKMKDLDLILHWISDCNQNFKKLPL